VALSDRSARVVLTTAWVLAIALVNPAGDFPINDDWSYAETVQRLVEHGEWRLNAWTSMPLATQVVWGWLFSQPAGFSFTALRLSSLCLGWWATQGAYSLLRLAGALPTAAFCGAATLAVCPVIFPLAFTFMTDVPALAFGVWSLVSILRYLEERRAWQLALALVLLTATTLIRQTGLALAIGATAALFVASRSNRDRVAALSCLLMPSLALFAYTAFVHRTGTPAAYAQREGQLLQSVAHPRVLASMFMHSAASAYLYLGLFLVPVIPLLARGFEKRRAAIAALVGLAASCIYVVKYHVRMPLLPNVFHDLGLSPVLVARADLWPRAPVSAWRALTAAAALAAAVVLYHVVSRITIRLAPPRRSACILCGIACVAYVIPLFVTGFMFDRYLGPTLLLALGFLASIDALDVQNRASVITTFGLLLAFAAFDLAATSDLFSYNRARWEAVQAALKSGVGAENLDGGFEVTGRLLNRIEGVPDARLMISLGDVEGYTRVVSYEFPRVIGARPGSLYLLQRDGGLR